MVGTNLGHARVRLNEASVYAKVCGPPRCVRIRDYALCRNWKLDRSFESVQGAIKFINHAKSYGFVTIDGNTSDAHFYFDDFEGTLPGQGNDQGRPVEFDLVEDEKGLHARRIKLLDEAATDIQPWANPAALGRAITLWAVFPRPFSPPSSRETYSSPIDRLEEIALPETWRFPDSPPAETPFPLLRNYLQFTFVKLCKQDIASGLGPSDASLRVSEDGEWAAFNTGLVDQLYDPIFALFARSPRTDNPPWVLYDFCVPGQGRSGVQLTSVFNPLPDAAKYFESSLDMLLDTDQDINIEAMHVIVDGIRKHRFPYEFLRQNLQPRPPAGLEWVDYTTLPREQRTAYLERLSEAIRDDPRAQRSIKNRLEDAKDLAIKRTKWNYKTAIPSYYARDDRMSLLVPMCLVDDQVVDIALVVSRLPSGVYQGHTVYPLKWAYQNARLVARPDSDWLVPDRISDTGWAEEDDDVGLDSGPDPWDNYVDMHSEGDLVQGTVQNVVHYGVFVDLADRVAGLIHISEISDDYVQDPALFVAVGETVTVRIAGFDRRDRKISLSLKTVPKQDQDA